ncbi:MAG: hypothetical protein V3575_06880 [Candidatus Absconditabacteria bacterium]
MVKFIEGLKKGLGIGIGIFVFLILGIILVKGDRSVSDPLKVEEGTTATLTTEKWNQMIDKINSLETQIANVNPSGGSSGSWAWSGSQAITAGVEYLAEKDLFINFMGSCSNNSSIQQTYGYIINPETDENIVAGRYRCQNGYNHTNSYASFIVPKGWKYKFNYTISINIWELN